MEDTEYKIEEYQNVDYKNSECRDVESKNIGIEEGGVPAIIRLSTLQIVYCRLKLEELR